MENLFKQIEQAFNALPSENSENRVIVVMAAETVKDENGKEVLFTHDLVIGSKGEIIDMLYNRMSDRNKEKNDSNVLPPLLRHAMRRFDLDMMLHGLCKQATRNERMAKEMGLLPEDDETQDNDAETAVKEADNE